MSKNNYHNRIFVGFTQIKINIYDSKRRLYSSAILNVYCFGPANSLTFLLTRYQFSVYKARISWRLQGGITTTQFKLASTILNINSVPLSLLSSYRVLPRFERNFIFKLVCVKWNYSVLINSMWLWRLHYQQHFELIHCIWWQFCHTSLVLL